MADTFKGGRGKKAPYTSTNSRVPKPLKPTIERFIAAYKQLLIASGESEAEKLIKEIDGIIAEVGSSEYLNEDHLIQYVDPDSLPMSLQHYF